MNGEERHQLEAALSRSQAGLSALTETIPALILIHQGGRCLCANAATETILGYPRAEIFKRQVWEFVRPDYRDLVRERALQREAGRELPARYEFPILTDSGQLRWLDCSARRVEFEGQPAVLVCALDVTERKEAEDKLRVSEERFRQVVEHIREVFWMADPRMSQILYISPGYEEIWGRTCASLYASPRDWLAAVHPDDRERVLEAALTKQVQGPYHQEYRILRPDGSVRWIEDRAFPVRNAAGEVYRFAGIAEDITLRKQAAERGDVFAKLGLRLSSAATAREAADVIVGIAGDLFGWDACYLHLYTSERNLILPVLTRDTIDGRKVDVPESSFTLDPSSLMLRVMRDGAQLMNRETPSAPQETHTSLIRFGDKARPSASMMYVPIRYGSKTLGILSIQSYTPLTYQQQDLETLQALADHCGGALARIHAAMDLQRLERQMDLLNRQGRI
ncbi:MAG TPA: PAS domain S-box protein [Verrucomicrobiae bacterium]|nr:PAS domain S-box protein [Verrucomicrobiae bacterium]